ncbi:hypothetical protein SH611_05295 [Geminicoccaceae bacterium 1502E]|nr:hypothetical protein [Geminicoccaceae bacterium 1502E]
MVAALEGRLVAKRVCPRCRRPGLMSRGRASGLRRLHCRGCGRTCNARTGKSLAHLHRKERWLDFARSLGEGKTVRQSVRRCAVAARTAFGWRHRFLRAIRTDAAPLNGIVAADEPWVLAKYGCWKAARASGRGSGHPGS